jgi:GT2 family glycosyltransferase
MLDVLMVIYRPRLEELKSCLEALTREAHTVPGLKVRLWHNDTGPSETSGLEILYTSISGAGLPLSVGGGKGNIGFGSGMNELVRDNAQEYVLVLNQDAIPEPGSIKLLIDTAHADLDEVAAWEMRQIPYEHPKEYDPVTLSVEWFSGAAVLLRTCAMIEVGGFEPRIFMYGEDVELSWRMRCAGYRLRYIPRAAVVHRTYATPNEAKPLQVLEGIYANLILRARYAGHRQIAQGLKMAWGELFVQQPFAGRRKGILKAIAKFARNYRYFWRTHQSRDGFEPRFSGWDFEVRREGAFHHFLSDREKRPEKPLVSILIRTHKRPGFLRQALTSVANQTYRPIEAVVVEDGLGEGAEICAEFAKQLSVHYHQLPVAQGRSVSGNVALSKATGQWFCFLDDDDLLFADHVEVLLESAQQHNLKGAYGLSWRVYTRILDEAKPLFQELRQDMFPDESFCKVVLWHHNFMPIQSVLFHRSLYEQNGGFEVDMDQLEDWNLWTRYTQNADFVQVRKLTSKYRVPADETVSIQRQQRLDAAYQDAVKRQEKILFMVHPGVVRQLALDYARHNRV